MTLVIKAGVRIPLTELSKDGKSFSRLEKVELSRRVLAVPIKALVRLPVGAARRSARSVTTASMLFKLDEERSASMPEIDPVRSPKSPVRLLLCLASSNFVRSASCFSSTGDGLATTIAGKSIAIEKNLKNCILDVVLIDRGYLD